MTRAGEMGMEREVGLRRLLLFGNSGSGKSTLARHLAEREGLAHLDLDSVAWASASPPSRNPLEVSKGLIDRFTDAHAGWVVEGCYADLLELLLDRANELIYLDLPPGLCIENARRRPWEPHKYSSRAAQDRNLQMLLGWIADYPNRDDACSEAAHRRLYARFGGRKTLLSENPSIEELPD